MKIKRILPMTILAALLILALSRIDGKNLLYSISQISLWLVLILFGLQIVSQLLINLQWHRIARLANIPISFRDMLYANCQGAVMDSITPGVKIGGEVARAVQISRISKCSAEQSAAVVATQKLFSFTALFLILPFVGGWLLALPFLFVFLCIFLMPSRIKSYLETKKAPRFSWIRKAKSFLYVLLDQICTARKDKRVWMTLFAMSLLIWLLYPTKMYMLAIQFYPDAQLFHIAAITFAAYMVAMLPIFPGGLGGFEATMAGLLAAMGVAISDAAVITIFFRFLTFWLVMLSGLAFIAFYNARKNRRSRRL